MEKSLKEKLQEQIIISENVQGVYNAMEDMTGFSLACAIGCSIEGAKEVIGRNDESQFQNYIEELQTYNIVKDEYNIAENNNQGKTDKKRK